MNTIARLTLIGALLCFAIFFGNVALGAAKKGVFLGDIPEMLLLLLSAGLFVAGVLCREAAENADKNSDA